MRGRGAEGVITGVLLRASSGIRVRCSYSHEAHSNSVPTGCPDANCTDPRLPGCASSFYCRPHEQLWWKCGWRGAQLKEMLAAHASRAGSKTAYNEVVLEAESVRLPEGVAAFWYSSMATPRQIEGITAAHHEWLNRFTQSHGAMPLLRYDPERSEPFREVNTR